MDRSGVILYDRHKAFKGFSLYNPMATPEMYLLDMEGRTAHAWSGKEALGSRWYHGKLCKNGDLLVIVSGGMLARLDWDSNVKWIKRMDVHHDVDVSENGDIYTLVSRERLVRRYGLPFYISDDCITVLSPDGEITEEMPLFEALKERIPLAELIRGFFRVWYYGPPLLRFRNKARYHLFCGRVPCSDIFHTNTVKLIDRDVEGVCRKGDLLICPRKLNLIGIMDAKTKKLTWEWKGKGLQKPHHPTMLENGNIVVFDNGFHRKYSRVVEIDPRADRIVWQYKADPPESFFSSWGGSAQRLPNGNTLITESNECRVFEVTRDGEVVWEFYVPELKARAGEQSTIYRMMRITDPENFARVSELQRN